jgi:UDP-4-amino-4-deoxy-L-arabinose formyltransferase/UDP-glucuronic acid dehydrogenase (UDP-4-keto-hexauronic acid decarboxylating)
MRFAALGRTHWLLGAIQACVDAGHECALIVTAPAAPEYRADESAFRDIAERLDSRFLIGGPELKVSDLRQLVVDAKAQVAISVNWPVRIPREVRELFPQGIINSHAGDLPRYRGNACPNWAILNGEDHLAVTLFRMDDGIDTGPILLKEKLPLDDRTYIFDIYRQFDLIVPQMFGAALSLIDSGTAAFALQPIDPSMSLRCYPRRPEDGKLVWSRPAIELGRLVRASAEPFAGAFCFMESGDKMIVWRAHSEAHAGPYCAVPGQVAEIRRACGEVAVIAGDGLLVLEEVETIATGRTRASAVIRSARSRLA